jgi:hypothetical protein
MHDYGTYIYCICYIFMITYLSITDVHFIISGVYVKDLDIMHRLEETVVMTFIKECVNRANILSILNSM